MPATLTINFDSPTTLGVGTYKATVQVKGCSDQACTQLVGDSPQNVSVTYTVTKSTFAIAGLSPSTAIVGAPAFVLAVKGSDFTPQSTVLWNGTPQPTTYVSDTQLTVQISTAQIAMTGNYSIYVSDPVNGTTNTETFGVQPRILMLSSLSPANVLAGGPSFALTAVGTGFTSQSVVLWNGTSQPTTFVSATQLTAQVPATEIAAVGSAIVTVTDPSATNPSNSETITIQLPLLALGSISPTSVTAGGPSFMLTVLG
ncbi:MAG: IPT/TIG domain-containing protein [Gammaproteobacteria bacterium]